MRTALTYGLLLTVLAGCLSDDTYYGPRRHWARSVLTHHDDDAGADDAGTAADAAPTKDATVSGLTLFVTAPADGTVVDGDLFVLGEATGSGRTVAVSANGAPLATTTSSAGASFKLSFDTTRLPNGPQTLVVTDFVGTLLVPIIVDNQPPIVGRWRATTGGFNCDAYFFASGTFSSDCYYLSGNHWQLETASLISITGPSSNVSSDVVHVSGVIGKHAPVKATESRNGVKFTLTFVESLDPYVSDEDAGI